MLCLMIMCSVYTHTIFILTINRLPPCKVSTSVFQVDDVFHTMADFVRVGVIKSSRITCKALL